MKIVAILLVLLALFFIFFIPSWGTQFISVVFLLVILLSFIYARILYVYTVAYRKVSVVRAHCQQCFTISYTVENRGPLAAHFIFVTDNTGQLKAVSPVQDFFFLKSWGKREHEYTVEGQKRGLYHIGPIVIHYSDPLGFFSWKKKLDCPVRVILYPRILEVSLTHDRGLPAGNLQTNNKIYEDMTRYRSLKEYVAGDDPRKINWKVSARLGRLYCIEPLPALYFPVFILLNLSLQDYPLRYRYSYWERAVEVASSLVYYFTKIGQDVGLLSTGRVRDQETGSESQFVYLPIRSGYDHAVLALEFLAVIREGADDFVVSFTKAAPKIPFACRICVVSPKLKENQLGFLRELRQKGFSVDYFQVATDWLERNLYHEFNCYAVKDYGNELIKA